MCNNILKITKAEWMTNHRRIFGLIGKNIDYSFSRDYFRQKFEKESVNDASYVNFDIEEISQIISVFAQQNAGYNVTIPYKKQIIPYLHQLSPEAEAIGAVNVVQILPDGKLKGHNTDWYGFYHSLQPLLKSHHQKALVLGTGGASEAVCYALDKLKISVTKVSRNRSENILSYEDIDQQIVQQHTVIVNCTPLGTFPNIALYPNIPYDYLTENHLLYDLIYNPAETQFLQEGKKRRAIIQNGYLMLELQAEESWKIWNE